MNIGIIKTFFFNDGNLFICRAKASTKNSRFVLAMFWITILFQVTQLKYIWAIEGLSRFFNLVMLLVMILYATHSTISQHLNKNVWYFYVLPGLFVFSGLFLNFALNSISNFNVMNYFGMLLPWAVYLAMPALIKKNACDSDILWRYFYYFMLAAVSFGFLDYFLVFSGASSLLMISTPNGEFLAGWFSLLHLLEDGSPYNRFYACFPEPGTLAMFLLPAIAYAYYNNKYIGLIICMVGLYLSESLGGIIGIAMIISLVSFIATNKRRIPLVIPAFVLIIVSSVIMIGLMDEITLMYEKKDQSAIVREDSFKKTIINLPSMLVNNPIGFELAEGTSSGSKGENYYGSNFAPGNALQMGGISAFLGYLVVLLVSLVAACLSIIRKTLSLEEKVVFCSLIVLFPFIVQRSTVWDSAIFAFLFAPSIIRFLQSLGNARILSNQS